MKTTADASSAIEALRADFPILASAVNGQPLCYLDNAATAQKPQAVIDALIRFYREDNANIHRGVHALSQRATDAYDQARARLAAFVGAASPGEIVFVRGATEGINLVAHSYLRPRLRSGDAVLVTAMEHHANFVPWQVLAKEVGAQFLVAPVTEDGELDREAFLALLETPRLRLVALTQVSNALGTRNPVGQLCAAARERGVPVLLDACQSVPHGGLDVQALGCDFAVFSGHKLFGPTGIGVLYGKSERLMEMTPYQTGGDMIQKVTVERTTFKEPPERFEAGTPDIAGVVGLAAAVAYLEGLEPLPWQAHEDRLRLLAEEGLRAIPGLRIVGTARDKAPVVSFVLEGVHPHDIGTFLDQDGIAIRAGHHCAQPLMTHLKLPGTARASFAFYNTVEEVERLVRGVDKVARFFR